MPRAGGGDGWRDGGGGGLAVFGGDWLQAAAQAGGVGRLVLGEQPAQNRAGVRIDEVDLGEIPGGEANFQQRRDADTGWALRSGGLR